MKKQIFALTLLLTLLITASQAQPSDTPAARQFSAWLDAFNSGERVKLESFLKNNHPARVAELDRMLQFREMTGGFEFKKTEEATATKYVCIVKERDSDQFARIVTEVEGV